MNYYRYKPMLLLLSLDRMPSLTKPTGIVAGGGGYLPLPGCTYYRVSRVILALPRQLRDLSHSLHVCVCVWISHYMCVCVWIPHYMCVCVCVDISLHVCVCVWIPHYMCVCVCVVTSLHVCVCVLLLLLFKYLF